MNDQYDQQSAPPPQPPARPDYSANKSVRAAICALVPGIGAVYNHEYMKAVVHFSVFAGLVIVAENIPVFGLAAFSFYVFTIIDAYRSAESAANLGPDEREGNQEINFPLWGSILILMGVLFLLDNLGAIRLRSAIEFWPLILVFIGFYLIFQYFHTGRQKVPATTTRRSSAEFIPEVPEQNQGEQ